MDLTAMTLWGLRAIYGSIHLLGVSVKMSLYAACWIALGVAITVLVGFWWAVSVVQPWDIADYGILSSIIYSLGVDIIVDRLVILIGMVPTLVFASTAITCAKLLYRFETACEFVFYDVAQSAGFLTTSQVDYPVGI